MTVAEKLIEQTGVIEKIEIGGFEILEGAFVGSYVHVNKIAALTAISAAEPNAEVLTKDSLCKWHQWELIHYLTKILTLLC
jgi:elongation factor Ts